MTKYERVIEMLDMLKIKGEKVNISELRAAYAKEFGVIDNASITRGVKSIGALGLIRINQDGIVEIL